MPLAPLSIPPELLTAPQSRRAPRFGAPVPTCQTPMLEPVAPPQPPRRRGGSRKGRRHGRRNQQGHSHRQSRR